MKDNKKIIKVLKSNPPFSSLSEERIIGLIEDARVSLSHYLAGEEVYTDTSYKKAIGVVLSGEARIFRSGGSGKVLLNRISEGHLFGVSSMFGEQDKFASLIVAQKSSDILFIPDSVCSELISSCPDFAIAYVTFLSDRIRFLNKRISEFSAQGVEAKLAKRLCEYDEPFCPNMKQLAESLGVGRASLYRIIDSFVERELIKKNGRQIIITDRVSLEKLI